MSPSPALLRALFPSPQWRTPQRLYSTHLRYPTLVALRISATLVASSTSILLGAFRFTDTRATSSCLLG